MKTIEVLWSFLRSRSTKKPTKRRTTVAPQPADGTAARPTIPLRIDQIPSARDDS